MKQFQITKDKIAIGQTKEGNNHYLKNYRIAYLEII